MTTQRKAANDDVGEEARAAMQNCASQMEDALKAFFIEWVPRVGYTRAVALMQTATAMLVASNLAKLVPQPDPPREADYLAAVGHAVTHFLPGMREALANARPDEMEDALRALKAALGAVGNDVAPLFVRPVRGDDQPN